MKRLLLPLLAALALPNVANANEKVLSEMSDIEANKILLGQVLSVCYAVDRNHITMKQKIDMLGFALNLHERAHGNKNNIVARNKRLIYLFLLQGNNLERYPRLSQQHSFDLLVYFFYFHEHVRGGLERIPTYLFFVS